MTLSIGEEYAIAATVVAFLLLGFALGRAAFVAFPLLGALGFLGVTIPSDEVYSRISEDRQVGILLALFGGSICMIIGVLWRDWFDTGRDRRRPRETI